MFRGGDDVIRRADLPRGFALVLSGHIHRHQVMRYSAGPSPVPAEGAEDGGGPTVVYAGSIERTSFAEAGETKGVVRVDLDAAGARLDFSPLPTRPMMLRSLSVAGLDARDARLRVASVIDATPPDAVLQLRVEGPRGPATEWLSASALRELAGGRSAYLVTSWQDAPRRAPGARAGTAREAPPRAACPAQLELSWVADHARQLK